MNEIVGELYDSEIVEGFQTTYRRCVFFDCELIGYGNRYIDCQFHHGHDGGLIVPNGSAFIGCGVHRAEKV